MSWLIKLIQLVKEVYYFIQFWSVNKNCSVDYLLSICRHFVLQYCGVSLETCCHSTLLESILSRVSCSSLSVMRFCCRKDADIQSCFVIYPVQSMRECKSGKKVTCFLIYTRTAQVNKVLFLTTILFCLLCTAANAAKHVLHLVLS